MTAIVPVACAVLINEKGECLLGSRPEGKPFAGWWEFPGGKMEGAESIAQTVQRELKEELGLRVENCAPWVTLVHMYPHATVKLHFARSWDWQGEPRALEAQKFGFFEPGQWPEPLLKASEPIARWLSLPKHWLYLKTAQAVEKLKEELHRHFDGVIVSAAVINHLDALKPQLKALGVSEIWCDDTVELEKMKQFDGVWVNDFTWTPLNMSDLQCQRIQTVGTKRQTVAHCGLMPVQMFASDQVLGHDCLLIILCRFFSLM